MAVGVGRDSKFSNAFHIFRVAAQYVIDFVSSRKFLYISIGWFGIQATYLACSTKTGIPPDELWHLGFIQLFAKNGFLPFIHDQTGFYWLGESVHTPFILYHYLLSIPYHLLQYTSPAFAVVFLRLINVALATVSLLLVAKLADRLSVPSYVKNISIFMLVNTLMFVFLAASINYDNLLFLIVLAALNILLNLQRSFRAKDVLWLILLISAGLLTNVNFLPIAFALIIFTLYSFFRNRPANIAAIRQFIVHERTWQVYVIYALTVLVVLLCAQRYLTNAVVYHTFAPACDRVNTVAQCDQYPVFRRNAQLFSAPKPPNPISIPGYFIKWVGNMNRSTFGILAQQNMRPSILISAWWPVLLAISGIAIVRKFSLQKKQVPLLAIAIFYVIVLFVTNYLGYRNTGVDSIAVQGRYLFVFLPLFLLISNVYITRLLKYAEAQAAYILVTIFIFATAGLPSFLLLSNSSWYSPNTAAVNTQLHSVLTKMYQPLKKIRR